VKKYFFKLLAISLLFAACTDTDTSTRLQGTFEGVFYRVRDNVKGESSNVTLNFSGDDYSGVSSIAKYPALCEGKFAPSSGQISFTNKCMWTADFDWTLILNGEFKIERSGDELILSKEISPGNVDYYVLRKQDGQTSR
jgi:hypothetical protein